jgi:hypothetical protein
MTIPPDAVGILKLLLPLLLAVPLVLIKGAVWSTPVNETAPPTIPPKLFVLTETVLLPVAGFFKNHNSTLPPRV